MLEDNTERLLKAIDRENRKIMRDKWYAHKVYMELGIMTKKGNLTRRWQKIRKLTGVQPRHLEAIRRALA